MAGDRQSAIVNRQSSILQRRPKLFPDLELLVETRLFSARELAAGSHVQGFLKDFAAHFFLHEYLNGLVFGGVMLVSIGVILTQVFRPAEERQA